MYAQVVPARTLPGGLQELERVLRAELLPALRDEKGFCGAMHLVHTDSDSALLIVCWETEQQASVSGCGYRAFGPPALMPTGLSDGCWSRVTVWEVAARD